MRSKGSVLTGVLLLALVVVVILGALWLFYPWLPPPERANRQELFRWLVTRDLASEPHATRLALANRLEEEIRAGIDWSQTQRRLDGSQQRRLRDNVLVILRPWFMDKVGGYFAVEPAKRTAYLDDVLETAACCRHVGLLPDSDSALEPAPAVAEAGEPGLLCELLARIDGWKEEADPPRRARIAEFAAAAQARWLQTRDLAEESAETRRRLARRLEAEIRDGVDWEKARQRIDPGCHRRLKENILLLAKPWLHARAIEYGQRDEADRPAYLDGVLEVVANCRGADILGETPPQQRTTAATQEDSSVLTVLLRQVDQWTEEADPAQRHQIARFVGDAQFRWMVTRDLRQEPPGTRLVLGGRLENALRRGVELSDARLEPGEMQQLWSNVAALAEPWLLEKVDRYWEAPRSERSEQVARVLDLLEACRGIRLPGLATGPERVGEEDRDPMMAILAQVEQWKREVPPDRARQIDQFVQAVRTQWLLRSLVHIPLG